MTLGQDSPDRNGWSNSTVTYGNHHGTVRWGRTSGYGTQAGNTVTTVPASADELALIEGMSR